MLCGIGTAVLHVRNGGGLCLGNADDSSGAGGEAGQHAVAQEVGEKPQPQRPHRHVHRRHQQRYLRTPASCI